MNNVTHNTNNANNITILVVEDDKVIFKELCILFKKHGYNVLDGNDATSLEQKFDIAVLDICLPKSSGYDICSTIRQTKNNCPIIFLTSLDSYKDELKAFSVGGDDFIKKPFNSSVLLARIDRLVKKSVPKTQISKGSLSLDTIRLQAKNDGQNIALSKTEFAILKILMQTDGVVGKRELIEKLWDSEAYVDENALYVNINRLRDKMRTIDLSDIIENVRKEGYRLNMQIGDSK